MTFEEARQAALSLPETTEAPHFEKTSFRVRGKIFATAPPDGEHLHIFIDEHAINAVVASHQACEPLWWGKRVVGVRVKLSEADKDLVADLLADAWRTKTPKGTR